MHILNILNCQLSCKEALKFGHNTGLAPFRLIVNLEKQNKLNQAIEVCYIKRTKLQILNSWL